MSGKITAVHVTHETVGKIGGIGAVLEGLFTSDSYLKAVKRSILVGPLFSLEGDVSNRLGVDGEVLYSSIDGMINSPYCDSFRHIEHTYNVNIVYGKRTYTEPLTGKKSQPEIILIEMSRMKQRPLNEFKAKMFTEFGIRSNMHEHLWEFEQYVRIALPAIAALKAIGAANPEGNTIVVAHEFMGMPTALAAKLDHHNFGTVFYAHEVATVRPIVEKLPGHDTMFYNVMECAHQDGLSITEVFGDQSHNFKHDLVSASRYCDNILAVGDFVVDELRFMAPEFSAANIDLTYNGIPAHEITLEEKKESRAKLQQYCKNLLGYKPDYIFTHVTRLVPSKGLWRDFDVLEHLDAEFVTEDRTAVLFVLSTETCQRHSRDIYNMEEAYNWPVAHREGMPDMTGGEAHFHTGVQEFNARSRNVKVIFINQFGFTRHLCGHRMPYDMEFMDIRKGSDVEFGQSIYEPFGIAQLEPLSFGGICVITNICGCAGFVNVITKGKAVKNVIVANYTDLGKKDHLELEDFLQIDKEARNEIESKISREVALEICARLPRTDKEFTDMIKTGYGLAKEMGWDAVAKNYVLKSFENALQNSNKKTINLK